MGVYSTVTMSRSEAIERIREEIDNIDSLKNEELSEILFALLGEKWLNNFCVVDN